MPTENIKLKISGIPELLKNIESIPKDVYEEAQRHIENAAKKVLETARANTPVHTGYLRSHYGIEVSGDISRQSIAAKVVNYSPHAHLIEFGHMMTTNNRGRGRGRFIKVVPAQPFIRPALETNASQAIDEMISGVNSALEKMEGRAK